MGILPADFETYKKRYEEVSIWRRQKIDEKSRKNERDKN
jgi:hypothetical protein